MKKHINKKVKKRIDKKCCFCKCDDYIFLNVHRIIPGKDGGKYTSGNSLTVCSFCHTKIHAGRIVILGKRLCTNGHYVVHFTENGEEKFEEI
jgi:hypothetical protein